jgi:2-dehydropantoate 2-reductase
VEQTILNLIGNATSAILDMQTRETFADKRVFKVEVAMLREALAVMRARAIGTVNLPGSPVQLLAFGVHFAPIFLCGSSCNRWSPAGAATNRHRCGGHPQRQSAIGDRRVERRDCTGGKSIGLKTPVNAALLGILHDLLEGKADRAEWRRNVDRLVELTAV